MPKSNTDGINSKPRTVMIVLRDDGKTNFGISLEGDVERIGNISPNEYTAAEMWGLRLFGLCQNELQTHGDVGKIKPPNRAERRR